MKRSILLLLTALALLTGCQATPPASSAAPQYPPYLSQRDSDGDGIDDPDRHFGERPQLSRHPPQIQEQILRRRLPGRRLRGLYRRGHPGAVGCRYRPEVPPGHRRQRPPGRLRHLQPDPNIDFRRVVNQNIYFQRHAISLTRDLSQVDQWQGGDIVVFHNHVGIVSDRRRADGLPYLLHHYSRFQLRYEQDALEDWGDAVGHYRVSE